MAKMGSLRIGVDGNFDEVIGAFLNVSNKIIDVCNLLGEVWESLDELPELKIEVKAPEFQHEDKRAGEEDVIPYHVIYNYATGEVEGASSGYRTQWQEGPVRQGWVNLADSLAYGLSTNGFEDALRCARRAAELRGPYSPDSDSEDGD